MNKFKGFIFFTNILGSVFEIQVLAPTRKLKDGITFFNFKINLDLFPGDHNPKFELVVTVLNLYNHILIHNQNHLWEEGKDEIESLSKESDRYVQLGIDAEKIITTELPSVVVWSLTRKRIVSGPDVYELIELPDGSHTLSVDNNRLVSLQCYSEISEDLLNYMKDSEGIIVTDQHRPGIYKFGLIPTE